MELEKLPRAGNRPEFREQAVHTYQESGRSVYELAKRLSLPESSLNHWVMAARKGKLASAGKNQKVIGELEMETSRLKREWAETKMERDFLKNVLSGRITKIRDPGSGKTGDHRIYRGPPQPAAEAEKTEVSLLKNSSSDFI